MGVETGGRPVWPDYLRAVDEALETGGFFLGLWEALVKESGVPIWLREWIEIEREAVALRWYENAFVPGLLQTGEYARSTLLAGQMFSAAEVEQRVAARMAWQSLLARDEKPTKVVAVLDEVVLRRTVDDRRDLMVEQLDHLVSCAELPTVKICVAPAAAGVHPGLAGSFILAETADGATFGHLDHQIGVHIVERASDIVRLTRAWDIVMGEALPRRQSLDLIKEAAKSWT